MQLRVMNSSALQKSLGPHWGVGEGEVGEGEELSLSLGERTSPLLLLPSALKSSPGMSTFYKTHNYHYFFHWF